MRIGKAVRSRGMTSPEARKGARELRGCRSRYCSPTAERFSTTALVSFGISVPRSSLASTDDAVA